jgi:GntR family transcriptional regulator, galactonate operon transcriptional repressor
MTQKPEAIRAELLAAILRGEYADRIPREEDLADAFEVSRGTARSAVQHLQAHDIVAVTHGRPGAAVRPPREWSLFDAPLLETVLDAPNGKDVLGEVLECRLLVAPEAAALAAERATADELDELGDRLEGVRTAARRPARLGSRASPELEFHRAVVEASHNRFLARVAITLETALAGRLKPPADALTHQQRILAALNARDAGEAREAMRARLLALGTRRRARR